MVMNFDVEMREFIDGDRSLFDIVRRGKPMEIGRKVEFIPDRDDVRPGIYVLRSRNVNDFDPPEYKFEYAKTLSENG